ncbi:DUF1801 domain-containing protein [Psychrobacillus vulpis]|uniref:DUF1801 domain-containing protein n=1 Tax=Psychrobacillus vulpis TaxID=2325572 RepID=A0A544TR37_9BACI|nr:DUF1801 domain-containing protein [Psychrobacillus vulpis]TQR19910.1 DUF1801 domain-containing protein [Psychrobacillus vulpis]
MTKNNKPSETTDKKSVKWTGPQQVIEFMNNLDHPLKEEIEEVRKIILNANIIISEHIKWNAPSYHIEGEDRITFNLHGKGFFRLIFHCGSKVKDNVDVQHLIDDTTGILEWVAHDRAIAKFTSINDVKAKEQELKKVITIWLEITCP